MTNKKRMMAIAIADGKTVDEAATMAGYNLPYARKVSKEPAFIELVERIRAKATPTPEERNIIERAWAIIDDQTASNTERVSAMRVLINYERGHKESGITPVIIDDIPPICEKCPRKDNDFADGQGIGAASAGVAEVSDDA